MRFGVRNELALAIPCAPTKTSIAIAARVCSSGRRLRDKSTNKNSTVVTTVSTHTVRRTPLPLSAVVRQANEQKKNWKDKNQSWCNRILYILGSHVVYHFRGGVCVATADAAAAISTAKFMRYSDPLSIAQFLLHNSVFLSRAVFFFLSPHSLLFACLLFWGFRVHHTVHSALCSRIVCSRKFKLGSTFFTTIHVYALSVLTENIASYLTFPLAFTLCTLKCRSATAKIPLQRN